VQRQIGDTCPRSGQIILPDFLRVYDAQVLQLPELQLEQELPPVPAMVLGTPLALTLKQAKVLIFGLDAFWHLGHSAVLLAWLKGRNCSNLQPHSVHTYSYIGITNLLVIV
jgi:hypothetical protein